MILVDTSILVGYFRGFSGEKYDLFDKILSDGVDFGICPFVYQEILQGAKNEKEFLVLKEFLDNIPMFDLRNGIFSYAKVALLSFRCRRVGITVRSTIDGLIAKIAIENNLEFFHNDSDYDEMAKVINEIKLYNV